MLLSLSLSLLLLLSLLFQTVSETTSLEVSKRSHPKCVCVSVCMCVCLSFCLSVFYLLLDHWRDRNETFRGHRHQPLDDDYIATTQTEASSLGMLGEWFLGSWSPSMSIYYQTVTFSSPLPSRSSNIDYLASSLHSLS